MSDDDRAEAVMSLGLTHEQMCYRLGEAWHEIDALRVRLAAVEAERDEAEDTAAHMVEKCGQAIARAEAAEARLAAVEAERDDADGAADAHKHEARELRARLAAVEALAADECMHGPLDRDDDDCLGCKLRAAARGEGDRD